VVRPTDARLLLVRHCESTGQAADAPLTARGRAQAETLATWLSAWPVDRIVTSPYRRAVETIAPFATRTSIEPAVDARLVERRLGPASDRDWRELVRHAFDHLDHRPPGGESGRDALARGRAAITDLLGGPAQLPLIVSHGQLIALLLHAVDVTFGFDQWQALSNPDVYALESTPTGTTSYRRLWSPPARA